MIRIDKNKTTVVELSNNEIDLIENLLFDHRLEHLKSRIGVMQTRLMVPWINSKRH